MIKRHCDAHSCFANNIKGECDILKDTDWTRKKGKACPFYAHRDKVDLEQIARDIHIYELWCAGRKSKEREDEDGRHNEEG